MFEWVPIQGSRASVASGAKRWNAIVQSHVWMVIMNSALSTSQGIYICKFSVTGFPSLISILLTWLTPEHSTCRMATLIKAIELKYSNCSSLHNVVSLPQRSS
jgi:hypothetical protein